jgi:hypothetical protein
MMALSKGPPLTLKQILPSVAFWHAEQFQSILKLWMEAKRRAIDKNREDLIRINNYGRYY